MASDAMLPEPAPAEAGTAEAPVEPTPLVPRRARHARTVEAASDTHPAWPAIVHYIAFGVAACLLILSSTFSFNSAVGAMNRQGWMVTGVTAVAVGALIAAAIPCVRVRCFRCAVESALVAGILAANWVCWLLNISIVSWIK